MAIKHVLVKWCLFQRILNALLLLIRSWHSRNTKYISYESTCLVNSHIQCFLIHNCFFKKFYNYFFLNSYSVLAALLCPNPWDIARLTCQAPLSMGFFRQEYWSGLTFPSPGDLPDQEIKLESPALQEYSLPSEPPENHLLWLNFNIYQTL